MILLNHLCKQFDLEMCILFFALSPPQIGKTKYKFILGSNRDEYYERPTQALCHWKDNPQILGSYDLKISGQGTWLGINSHNGQFATLTNYRISHAEQNGEKSKKYLLSRGKLVTDFITSSVPAAVYTSRFLENRLSYGKSNLITGNLNTDNPQLIYSTNAEDHEVVQLSEGIHNLSNKTLDYPWQKQVSGSKQFTKVIEEFSEPQQLIEEVVRVMSDDITYQQDPSVDDLDWEGDWKIPLSSIFVTNKDFEYGTRTISVILVEKDGRGWYYEQSLKEPIDSSNMKWVKELVNFQLNN